MTTPDNDSILSRPHKPGPALDSQRTRLFRIYNQYRVVVSLILVALIFVSSRNTFGLQYRFPVLYESTAVSYLGLNLFIAFVMVAGFNPRQRHVTLSILLDIFVLHLLLFFSSGIGSGLANLVIISVAAGNILVPSRIGIFYAALATLGSLGLVVWGTLIFQDGADAMVRAGFLGLLYFSVAFLLQHVTRRLILSETLAQQRGRSLAELQRLNHQIIQRMRTGIVVSDTFGHIRMANLAAAELLSGRANDPAHGKQLPQPLKQRLERWLRDPLQRTEPFQAAPEAPVVQANFTRLSREQGEQILIFLEDTSKIAQQAQQLKLASLGRLTAGIAHEIRNPLGAISHAAQLLAESPDLEPGDRKMTDIIQRHSGRVNGIIENVLQLSRRREAEAELFDLNTWIRGFVDDYQSQMTQSPELILALSQESALARFDQSQLEQVLTNLCENGLRYSFANTGHARLWLTVGMSPDGERAYIDIEDEGKGVSAEQRATIFEPFYTTEKTGTGLGLYLARELCEANQAQLSLVTGTKSGCCFRITFAHSRRLT